jgi:hypothetical protein
VRAISETSDGGFPSTSASFPRTNDQLVPESGKAACQKNVEVEPVVSSEACRRSRHSDAQDLVQGPIKRYRTGTPNTRAFYRQINLGSDDSPVVWTML